MPILEKQAHIYIILLDIFFFHRKSFKRNCRDWFIRGSRMYFRTVYVEWWISTHISQESNIDHLLFFWIWNAFGHAGAEVFIISILHFFGVNLYQFYLKHTEKLQDVDRARPETWMPVSTPYIAACFRSHIFPLFMLILKLRK